MCFVQKCRCDALMEERIREALAADKSVVLVKVSDNEHRFSFE